jgi:hypothetical protein
MHTYIITEVIEDNGKSVEVIVNRHVLKEKALELAKKHQRVYEVRRLHTKNHGNG